MCDLLMDPYLWVSLIEICESMPYGRYAVGPGHLHVLNHTCAAQVI